MQRFITTGGLHMAKLGLGTWRLSGDEARRAVAGAVELGYRHIDTARMYGNEEAVGDALASVSVPRGDLHVTSKVWHTELAPDDLRRALETSLRLLRLDCLDLYLIHWPSHSLDMAASLETLTRLREEGLLRAIGVSNFTVALLRRAVEEVGAPIACNQVEYHVGLSQRAVLDYCRAHDIAVVAYSPLGQGKVAGDKVLGAIARKHGATSSQVALKWLLDQDGVAAVPKAASRENQRANLDACAVELDAADRAAIDALPKDGRMVNPAWAPAWDPA